jgi:hypothetical protein
MRLTVILLPLALLLSACGGFSPDWQTHEIKDLGVSLAFPGAPVVGEDGDAGCAVEGFSAPGNTWPRREVRYFHADGSDWSVHFGYEQGDLPACLKGLSAADALKHVRRCELRFHDAKYVTDSESRVVSRDGLKGIAFESDPRSDGKMYRECFIAGGKVHVLSAYAFGKVNIDTARFFESLKRKAP